MGHLLYTVRETQIVLLTMTSSLIMFLWAGVALLASITRETFANFHLLRGERADEVTESP